MPDNGLPRQAARRLDLAPGRYSLGDAFFHRPSQRHGKR